MNKNYFALKSRDVSLEDYEEFRYQIHKYITSKEKHYVLKLKLKNKLWQNFENRLKNFQMSI